MAQAGCRGASDAVGAGARVSWTTSFHKTDQAVRLDVPKLGPPVAGQYAAPLALKVVGITDGNRPPRHAVRLAERQAARRPA